VPRQHGVCHSVLPGLRPPEHAHQNQAVDSNLDRGQPRRADDDLDFMDGLASCCGDERVMVFTMTDDDKDDVDPWIRGARHCLEIVRLPMEGVVVLSPPSMAVRGPHSIFSWRQPPLSGIKREQMEAEWSHGKGAEEEVSGIVSMASGAASFLACGGGMETSSAQPHCRRRRLQAGGLDVDEELVGGWSQQAAPRELF
jgi:hypothetical protein